MTIKETIEDRAVPLRVPVDPSAGECLLFLVRHGTTTLNVQNRYRGRRDVPLDAQGYQDAVDAARQLSVGRPDRGVQRPAASHDGHRTDHRRRGRVPDLRILHGLNNVDYGAWEGLTAEEAGMYSPEAFSLYRSDPMRAVCPAGERLSDAQRRMVEAIELIGTRHPGEPVAAVTHAVMIRLLVVRAQPDGEARTGGSRSVAGH